jgi:hypothetical protein
MESHLNNHHRETVEKIFGHPVSGNLEWRQVLSLLEDIGTVTAERNGKLKVGLGPETEVFRPPRGKDVDAQMVVDLRRMLQHAGFARAEIPQPATSARGITATASGASQPRSVHSWILTVRANCS